MQRHCQIFNQIYNNSLEANDEEEKEPIDAVFVEHKADPKNDEIAVEFKWSDVQGEDVEHITKVNLIENKQK